MERLYAVADAFDLMMIAISFLCRMSIEIGVRISIRSIEGLLLRTVYSFEMLLLFFDGFFHGVELYIALNRERWELEPIPKVGR